MPSVSFQPTPQDLLAAYRLNFRTTVKSKRVLRAYLIGGAGMAAMVGIAASRWHFASVAMAALCGLLYWLVIFSLIIAVGYLQLSRRVRHVFHQQKALHDEATVEWSDAGISFISQRGHSNFAWEDFIGVVVDRDVIIFRQSELLINFIPTRILNAAQRADFAAKG